MQPHTVSGTRRYVSKDRRFYDLQNDQPVEFGLVSCAVLCLVGVVQCGVVWCGVVWCGVVWCGVVWCVGCGVVGVVWCGVVWCGVVCGCVLVCWLVWCGGALTRAHGCVQVRMEGWLRKKGKRIGAKDRYFVLVR
jgi:hypothetical protein